MSKVELLQQIETNVKNCKKCRLCETALNSVPGEGNYDAEIVFIGEAPGATEDKTGRPFVGRAGKLLEGMLNKINFGREDVWIGNVIKHRPPNNRDPLPDEIKACEPYLTMQLEIIKPKLIITLGRFAMNYFYPDGKISRDHGQLIKVSKNKTANNSNITDTYNDYPLYHPAAALRNKSFAKALLQDFLKIPDILASLEKNEVKQNSDETKLNPLGL